MNSNIFSNEHKWRIDLFSLTVVCLFLSALAGQFTLSRISSVFENLGLFDEIRVLLVGITIILTVPLIILFKNEQEFGSEDVSPLIYLALVIMFHLYMILSYTWSPQGDNSNAEVLSLSIVVVIMLLSYLLARIDTYKTITIFLYAFFIASLIYAVGSLLFSTTTSVRLSFFWGGPNVFVRVIGTGAVVALYLWIKTDRKIWLASIPLLLFAAIMAGSRGGLTSLLITMPLALFLLVKKARRMVIIVGLIAILVVILLYLPVTAGMREYIEKRYPLDVSEFGTQYESSRGAHFSSSLEAFGQYPILGLGVAGLFDYAFGYSHNLFLNIAAEGGIMGLFLLALMLIPLFFRWRKKREIETTTCFLIAIFYLMASMASGTYYDWRFIWIFFLFYMMPLSYSKDEQEEKDSKFIFSPKPKWGTDV